MIADKVLGAYASIGAMPASEQAEQYRKAHEDWGINTFELPLMAGQPLPGELVEVFSGLSSSLVVTMVTQWAIAGQQTPAYGLSSTEEAPRRAAILDVCSALQQCLSLSGQGIRIRNLVVHAGQRCGGNIPHAIAFFQSLAEIRRAAAAALPECRLAVEVTDSRPLDHPIAFPASKKASLNLSELMHVVAAVNRETLPGNPVSLMLNWGRLLINEDEPLSVIDRIMGSEVALEGVILSGAGASKDGFMDTHNSHLDPDGGFSARDAEACAAALKSSSQSAFIGMKCSVKKGDGEVSTAEVLNAQADLLNRIG